MNLQEDLEQIEAFLKETLQESERLAAENQRLKEENKALQQQIKAPSSGSGKIDNKSLNLQIENISGNEQEKKELVSRIDEMMREIDHCLKLLNAQLPK